MMTWTRVHLESMNILQLKELKKHVDEVLNEKVEQSKRLQMKPWQKGIDLDTLLAHTKRFENYNKFSCSPFSEMKKNDIAEHLSNGTVVNLKGSTFTIQECKTRSLFTCIKTSQSDIVNW